MFLLSTSIFFRSTIACLDDLSLTNSIFSLFFLASELMTTTNNNDPTITNTNPMAYYNSQYDPYTMNLVAHHNSSYNPYVTHSTAYYKSQHDPYNVPTKSTACIIV